MKIHYKRTSTSRLTDFLPFSRPSIDNSDISTVTEVLRSGWLTTGAKNTEFENSFCHYCGSDGAVALSSATAGIHLILQSLDIGPGDEVITPSMTWVSTVNMIVSRGATPIFADIDRDTLMSGTEHIEPLLSRRTKLIVPVHFAGAAADILPLRALAASRGIPLVEDAAHAAGSEYNGEKIGSRGTAIFSFHPAKNITSGEGGMICSDDEKLLRSIRRLKFHGLEQDAYDRRTQGRKPRAQVVEPGFKYNLTDIAAALGTSQLKRLDSFIRQRKVLADRYLELLQDVEEIEPLHIPPATSRHAWHLFVIRLNDKATGMDRDTFMEELAGHNIGTGIHFKAVHEHTCYRRMFPTVSGQLPATEWNSARLCSLPLFPEMRVEDVENVVSILKEVLTQ
jgi:UDP-4-amino-4-deoxy-L-arabinose-oxoglutarate aminotransferase